MAALVIGEKQREQIAKLIADATANPVDKPATALDIAGQVLVLPVGYLVAYSHECDPKVGLCHTIAIGVARHRKLPHPKAIEMILKEFGMRPLGDASTNTWIDDIGLAFVFNVVQPVDCGRSSGMVALSSVLHTTSREDANTGRTGAEGNTHVLQTLSADQTRLEIHDRLPDGCTPTTMHPLSYVGVTPHGTPKPTTERRLIVRESDVCWLYPDGSHRCVTQGDVDELNRLRESRAILIEAARLVRTKEAT
jgi:hypothetical protein